MEEAEMLCDRCGLTDGMIAYSCMLTRGVWWCVCVWKGGGEQDKDMQLLRDFDQQERERDWDGEQVTQHGGDRDIVR
jgi:hypothetical protein